MKRKMALLAGVLLMSFITAKAEWKDITSSYFSNPGFDNNQTSGWMWNSNAQSQTANYNCFEFWNGVFDFFQSGRFSKGKYRLSVQGFYRRGDFDAIYEDFIQGNEQIPAVLYASIYNEETGQFQVKWQKPLASVFSYFFPFPVGGSWAKDGREFPNNMYSAAVAFADDAYQNVLEFELKEDAMLELGVSCQEYTYSNWCIFDNFKLEFEGEIILASDIDVHVAQTELIVGESTYCYAEILPENAMSQEVVWSSSHPEVASIHNGQISAHSPGTTTITATTIDGSNISKSVTLTVKEDDLPWIDVTDIYLKNPRFDNNSTEGWVWSSNASSQKAEFECFEFWNGMFFFYQNLDGLLPGKYKISVQGYYRNGDNEPAYEDYLNGTENISAYLISQTGVMPLKSIYSFGFEDYSNGCWTYYDWSNPSSTPISYPNNMESAHEAFSRGAYNNSLIFEYNGKGFVGINCDNYTQSNWCIFDNFKLEYSGDIVKAAQLSVSIDKTELIVTETAQCTATILPEDAFIKDVKWSSNDERVATVDKNGKVTAVGEGDVVITATTIDGSNLTSSVSIRVVDGKTDSQVLVVNEIMVSNVDDFVSPAYNFDGWMEIYNSSNMPVRISGMYLSDDAENPTLWKIPNTIGAVPAHGFTTIWFESNDVNPINAPFKLDVDGGKLFLSDQEGKIILDFTYPQGVERISYARMTDGGTEWGYTSTPTPGKSNAGAVFANAQLSAPVVDQPSQLFSGTLTVNVTIPAGCQLKYTTDGTVPTMNNGETSTTGQFVIDDTKCYRFRLFAEDMLPSRVTTRSYIFEDMDYILPVVSVVSDPKFLYSDTLGVMVRGTNGRPGNGQSGKCNWNMSWDRPVNFSYLTADGEMVLNQDVNLEMCGGWSRAWEPHAFKLKGSKEMGGDKNLPYPFFDDKPYIRNRTLQIRNGGNDTGCRIKDPALQYIVQSSGIDVDCQSYQPVHEFINGKYIGVLNVREPNNKHYVYANYGWDEDEIDQFEMSPDSGYVQKCGSDASFLQLVDYLSVDAANSDTYAEICKILDVDAYINYMAIELYLCNWDWPQNNVKGFRKTGDGKYRFVLFDLDGAYNNGGDPFSTFMGKSTYTFDPLYPSYLGRITDKIKFVDLFANLLNNSEFRRKFIDTFCIIGGSVFEANRAVSFINMLVDRVNPAMRLNGGSANNTANNLKNVLMGHNESAISSLKNYWAFELSGSMAQNVRLESDVEGAKLLINGIQVPTGYFNGKLFQPATITAVAPAGYSFLGWAQGSGSGTTILASGSTWKYYDQGTLDGTSWQYSDYDDSRWKTGNTPMGYEKNGIVTRLDYGDRNNKRPTSYFRTELTLEKAPTSNDEVTLHFTIDDGMVVYVNGREAGRYNMPSGKVDHNTFASTYAPDNPDMGSMTLPSSLFYNGRNVIAVEVHNNSATSTDLYWDAEVKASFSSSSTTYYSKDAVINLPEGNVGLVAKYRPLTDAELRENGTNPLCVNEVSASNSCFINEYGKKNDWVEIYNNTDKEIDLEGMYLTDDLSNPTKCKISKGKTSANTIIAPHGYLIIWCDKLETTYTGLHASFKISGNSGIIALTAADRSWTDILCYSAHDGNSTVGRFPDGAKDVYLMNVPTIEKSNILTSYMTAVSQTDDINNDKVMIASANGLRICYGAQHLIVKSEEDTNVVVGIYTTDGRQVSQQQTRINHGTATIDVSVLAPGFYIAKATDEQHTQVGCKFMK